MITIFKTSQCSKCKDLASFLTSIGQAFEERNMEEAEAIADLRADWNYFGLQAPILTIDDSLFPPDVLFDAAGNLKREALKAYLGA